MEAIPNRGAYHPEGMAWHGGGTSKRYVKKTLFSWAEGSQAPRTDVAESEAGSTRLR